MAIVLVVVGLLLTSVLSTVSSQIDGRNLRDTNDALNRDTVALAQLQQLQQLLAQTESPDSDESLDTLKQTAQILRRLNREPEAMAIEVPLLPKYAARFGADGEEYGKLLQGYSSSLAGSSVT